MLLKSVLDVVRLILAEHGLEAMQGSVWFGRSVKLEVKKYSMSHMLDTVLSLKPRFRLLK